MDAPADATPPKTPMVPMCLACGQMLKGQELKCPSCGAPIRRRNPGARSGKLTIATVVFFGLALLTGALALSAVWASDATTQNSVGQPIFPVSGTAYFENGTVAPNVLVALDGNASSALTDANGTYSLPKVAFGFHEVSFALDNHTSMHYKVFVRWPETVDATLTPGTGAAVLEDDSYAKGQSLIWTAGAVYGALALLLAAAGVATLRRRFYALALAGAWLSLLDVITTAGITAILSLVLIILVMRSKREFR